jgi:hypothetical protein
MQTVNKKKDWHPEQVDILKRWGEQSSCYRYMHYKAYQNYKKSSMRFTLPIIIISTLTGTANFAQETFPESWKHLVPVGIGGLNLVAAIMTTILQFLKINELMESHRVSSVHYGKLSRSIRLQLTLPPAERSHRGSEFVDFCNQEYDRLIEQSPPVPGNIIKTFEKEFPEIIENLPSKEDKSCLQTFLCCSNETIQKDPDLNLERPEIIKLSVIKPYEHILHKNVYSQVSGTSTPISNTTPKGIGALRKLFATPHKKPPPPPPPLVEMDRVSVASSATLVLDEVVIPPSEDDLKAAETLTKLATPPPEPEPEPELSVGERIAQLEQELPN